MSDTTEPIRSGRGVLLAAILFTGLGLAVGRYAAILDGGGGPDDHADELAHDHDGDGVPDHGPGAEDEHDHGEDVMEFSPVVLTDMGVTFGELRTGSWGRSARITARIEADPLAQRAVHTALGGRVLDVPALEVGAGGTVSAGASLVVLAREPLPLPALEHTRDAVHPEHGELHDALRLLLQSEADAEIARDELARLEEFSGEDAPLVPRDRIVALEYDVRRAEVRAVQARRELELHGLSDEQITRLVEHGAEDGVEDADGGHAALHAAMIDAATVRRALAHRGQWGPGAERLYGALPEPVRSLPLAVGTVGELAASGVADAELVDWFEGDPGAASRVLSIGALLLGGRSVADVRALYDAGALAETVEITAPAEGGPWRLTDVDVRPGATVPAGAALVHLVDLSRVRLVASPVGGEARVVRAAVASGTPCRATPLLPGTGPVLDAVHLAQATADARGGLVAWASLANEPLAGAPTDGAAPRTWSLLPGTRYVLRVPVERFEGVWVLPRTALAEHGAERMVLLPDAHGDVFEEVPVAIAAEDDEVFVLRPEQQDERLAPGLRVVTEGAFALGLALHGGDEAAGHHHDH